MEIVRSTVNAGFRRREPISRLLSKLGVVVSLKGFWGKSKLELEWILSDARKSYDRMKIKIHPRSSSDDDKPAQDLHALWQEIEHRFNEKLHPQLVPNVRRIDRIRVCAVCAQEFIARYRNKTCRPECSEEYKRWYMLRYYYETTKKRRQRISDLSVQLHSKSNSS